MPTNLAGSSRICWTESSTLYSAQETACTHGACANDALCRRPRGRSTSCSECRCSDFLGRCIEIGGASEQQATSAKRQPMKIDLSGRTAVITGGSRGLGEAMARTLAGANAQIALVARDHARLQ